MIVSPLTFSLTHTNTEHAEHDVVQSTKWKFSHQLQLVLPKWLLPSVPGAHALCAVLH